MGQSDNSIYVNLSNQLRSLKPNKISEQLLAALTLSLTVSFILELALLTAEYKNDPKFFAPCVTFVVTVNGNEREEEHT